LNDGSTQVSGSGPRYTSSGTPTPLASPTTPAPTSSGTGSVSGQPIPYGQDASQYGGLLFQDEFDGSSLDSSKWVQGLWYEGAPDSNNHKVQNGALYMWPSVATVHNCTITTDGKFYFTYGFFEVEAQLPTGPAAWPAIWLYAHDDNNRPEIDIMEAYSGAGSSSGWADDAGHPTNYGVTLHASVADGSSDNTWDTPYKLADSLGSQRLDNGFHKYGCRWDSSGVTFYFDGQPIHSKWSDNTGYFSNRMYFLLDLWLGPAFNGNPSSANMGESNPFIVNYVRVWSIK
jgi:beta-glucanase (GH16 family)